MRTSILGRVTGVKDGRLWFKVKGVSYSLPVPADWTKDELPPMPCIKLEILVAPGDVD